MAFTSKRVYNWFIALTAASCMTLYGFDASVFNALQGSQHWLDWFDLDPVKNAYKIGLINTCYTIGAIVSGFFFAGPIGDYFGRKIGMMAGCFVTIIAAFMQAFAPKGNLGCFIAGRVLIGVGQGIALTNGPVYINEIAPAQIRGHIMTFWQMFYSVGSFIAYWVNYACGKNSDRLGQWDWRMVVVFQILVPVTIIAVMPFQPESPRWHVRKNGNVEAARACLLRIRESADEAEEELLAIREAIEYEKEAISPGYWALLKDKSIRKRLFLAFVINGGQQLGGQGTLNSYSTSIYKEVFTSANTINLINALNATCGILFTLNAVWTADRFGRRWLLIVGGIGMGVCMLVVATVGLATPSPGGTKSQPVAISFVFMLFLFIFFYKPSWGATVWIWTTEIFSANVRVQAVGMASQFQNVANTIFQQFFPIFLANDGLKCLYFFMAANFCLVVFVYYFIPETKGVALEQMDVIFGGADHTEKGADLLGIPHEPSAAAPVDNSREIAEIQGVDQRREVV